LTPGNPTMEKLDREMQKGYKLLSEDRLFEAIHAWWETWEDIKYLMAQHGITDVDSFDDVFNGTQSVFNWASDFEMELGNAAVESREYCQQRIDFCREYLERYNDPSELNAKGMKVAIAESYFKLGEADEGDKLFEQLVAEYPRWAWGWINWSDQYNLWECNNNKQPERAIEILKRGLEVPGLEDKRDVHERLKDIYSDLGMQDEAVEIDKEIKEIQSTNQTWPDMEHVLKDFRVASPAVVPRKIGRNEPCSCGSGKKYKKCCGR